MWLKKRIFVDVLRLMGVTNCCGIGRSGIVRKIIGKNTIPGFLSYDIIPANSACLIWGLSYTINSFKCFKMRTVSCGRKTLVLIKLEQELSTSHKITSRAGVTLSKILLSFLLMHYLVAG